MTIAARILAICEVSSEWTSDHPEDDAEACERELLDGLKKNSCGEERLNRPVIEFEDGLEWSRTGDGTMILRTRKESKTGESWIPRIHVDIDSNGVVRRIYGNVLKKHHKYLIPLLLKDFVKGVRLSGSDFSLDDLDDSARDGVRKRKPELFDK